MVHTLIARMIGLEAERESEEREGDRDGGGRNDGVKGGLIINSCSY